LRFNERIIIDGEEVSDSSLIDAFKRVEQARGHIRLTFFEFGTLLAIDLFAAANLELVILEVGLGGRLDATNILDADVAILSSISIDHTAWLGDDIEQIAAEKIAIAKPGQHCVLGMHDPQNSIIEYCNKQKITPLIFGRDFHAQLHESKSSWHWWSKKYSYESIALPFGKLDHQITNAAIAIQAVQLMQPEFQVMEADIRSGIENAQIVGRQQIIAHEPLICLDVAHNVASIKSLRDFVQRLRIKGRVFAVCGMLQDKQIGESLLQMVDCVDKWYFTDINNERGAKAKAIRIRFEDHLQQQEQLQQQKQPRSRPNETQVDSAVYVSAVDAYKSALATLNKHDCLLVFGSFFLVSDIIRFLQESSS
jgi:dihydrofolate synthase/folylpolyglutamate synthase